MAKYYVSDLNHLVEKVFFPESKFPDGDKWHFVNHKTDRSFDYRKHGCLACPKTCDSWTTDPVKIHLGQKKCSCFAPAMDEYTDDVFRILHYYEIYNNITEVDEVTTSLINNEAKCLVRKYYKKPNARTLGNKEGLSFYTIVPKSRLPYSEVEVEKMRDFCEKFFSSKYFKKCWWVIESGKHEKSPNLHIHLLGQFKWKSPNESMSKNFKRNLITAWNKCYPNPKFNISYKESNNVGIHHVPCNTDEIRNDKLTYMTNSEKGSHENFIDLGVKGGFS